MTLFYGFSQPFSLSFRFQYLVRSNNAFKFVFREVLNLFQTAHYSDRSAYAGDGFRV